MAKKKKQTAHFFVFILSHIYINIYILHMNIHLFTALLLLLMSFFFCFVFYTLQCFFCRSLIVYNRTNRQQIAFNLPKKKNVRRLPLNFTHLVSLVCTNSGSFNIMCYICYSRFKIIDKRSHSKWFGVHVKHTFVDSEMLDAALIFCTILWRRALFVSFHFILSLSSMIFAFTSLPVYFNFLMVEI